MGLAATMAGCGGGEGTSPVPPTTPGVTRVGAAGGTVTGDDGASVTVPAGVMKQDSTVTIAISKNSAGAPVAPPGDGFIQVSNVFTVTPHGHGFAEPVQVTLPFDDSLVRDTDQLVILKAQPRGSWVAHSDVTRQGATATLAVRDFSVFMVVIRTGMRIVPAPSAPAPVPFSFSLAVSGTSPNLTITYTFSGTRPTCVEGDRLETVFMTVSDDSYRDPVVGFPVHSIAREELLAVMVPSFSPPAPALTGTTLTHAVIQPVHSAGGSYGSGSVTVSPYVKGRYTCTSELLAGNAVAAPWTFESANESFLPNNASGMVLLGDIADVQTSVGAPIVSRARAQTAGSYGLQSRSRWEISRDNGASWAVLKLGAERVTLDTSVYSAAAAQAAGLWAIEGDLPAFAATDNGALLRFAACTAIAPLYGSGDPPSFPCATGAPHTVSVAFLAQEPSFTAMPAPMAVVAGAGASFSVVAAGLPTPTLQWRRRLPSGAWEDIAGATGPTYQLSTTTLGQDGTQFQAVASNASGSVTSAPATLNVVDQAALPAITGLSGPLTVVQGGAAVFAATVRGTEPLSFQWRRNGVDVLGANAPILRLDAVAEGLAGAYTLHVGNPAGTAQSAAQQLSVVPAGTALPTAPSIITQPVSVRVNTGNTATFAVGTGGSDPLAYQWRRDNVDIPGATAAFYSIASTSPGDAATYSVVVSNGAGSATSASVVLTVDAAVQVTPPIITAQPGAVVVAPGMSAMLGVSVQGSGPMSFQWLRNGVAVAGQTQATYALVAASALDAGDYQVRVSNGVGEVTSATAQVILLGAPSIAVQPSNRSATEGSTATFQVTASGDYPRYQWTRNQAAIAGATSASYTTPVLTPADSGAVYGVVVYNGAGLVFSQGAVLTVTPLVAPSFATQPSSQSVVAPATATFSIAVSGSPAPTLQWQQSSDGGATWADIAGATSTSHTTAATSVADSGRQLRVVASNAAGQLVSSAATLTVTAVAAPGPLVATAFATGYASSLVVAADGSVWAWGYRVDPTTGGYKSDSPWATRPVQVQGLSGVKAVAVTSEGGGSSYALHTDGTVSAWGVNTSGQLGDRTAITRLLPVKVLQDASTPMDEVCSIAAGANILLMARETGCSPGQRVVAPGPWIAGFFSNTTIGGNTSTSAPLNGAVAKAVPGWPVGQIASQMSAPDAANAPGAAFFATGRGDHYVWGANGSNLLGAGASTSFAGSAAGPVSPPGLFWSGVSRVELGRDFSIGLDETGSLVGVGRNVEGQLGNGTTTGSTTPLPVLVLSAVTDFSVGQTSAAAVMGGQLWAWGWNGNMAVTQPTRVGTGIGFTQVSVGDIHSLAIGPGGEVYSWGDSSFGALGRSGGAAIPAVVMRP